MTCADLARIINSDQVQAKLKEIKHTVVAHDKAKKNPLKNATMMKKLNPYAAKAAEIRAKAEKDSKAKRAAVLKAKRSAAGKKEKQARNKVYQALQSGQKQANEAAEQLLRDEEAAGNYMPGDTTEEEEDY